MCVGGGGEGRGWGEGEGEEVVGAEDLLHRKRW